MARRQGISVDDVVDAAAAIADSDGLASVTLAGVAARVGIRSPSLYAHIESLDDLRRLLALRAAGQLKRALANATRGSSGLEALSRLMHALRDFATQHPGLYAAAQRAVRPGEDDELYAALASVIAPVLAALSEAGVPSVDQVHLTRAIRSALHGFVVLEQGGGFGMPEDVDESYDRLVELICSGVAAAAATPP